MEVQSIDLPIANYIFRKLRGICSGKGDFGVLCKSVCEYSIRNKSQNIWNVPVKIALFPKLHSYYQDGVL